MECKCWIKNSLLGFTTNMKQNRRTKKLLQHFRLLFCKCKVKFLNFWHKDWISLSTVEENPEDHTHILSKSCCTWVSFSFFSPLLAEFSRHTWAIIARDNQFVASGSHSDTHICLPTAFPAYLRTHTPPRRKGSLVRFAYGLRGGFVIRNSEAITPKSGNMGEVDAISRTAERRRKANVG